METLEERIQKEKGRKEYCKRMMLIQERNKLVVEAFRCNVLNIYTMFIWYNAKDIYGEVTLVNTYSVEDREKIRNAKKGEKRDTKELGCIPRTHKEYRSFDKKKYEIFNGLNTSYDLSPHLSKDMMDEYAVKENVMDTFSIKELFHMYCIAHAIDSDFYEILIGKRKGRINRFDSLITYIRNHYIVKGMKGQYIDKILMQSKSTLYSYLSSMRNTNIVVTDENGNMTKESREEIEFSILGYELEEVSLDYVYINIEYVRKRRNKEKQAYEYEVVYQYGNYIDKKKQDRLKKYSIYVDDIGCGIYEKLLKYVTARRNRILLVEEYNQNIYEEVSVAIDYAIAWNKRIYKIQTT